MLRVSVGYSFVCFFFSSLCCFHLFSSKYGFVSSFCFSYTIIWHVILLYKFSIYDFLITYKHRNWLPFFFSSPLSGYAAAAVSDTVLASSWCYATLCNAASNFDLVVWVHMWWWCYVSVCVSVCVLRMMEANDNGEIIRKNSTKLLPIIIFLLDDDGLIAFLQTRW